MVDLDFQSIDSVDSVATRPAASIWFENWGVVDPGEKNSIFSGNFTKIIDFSGQISKKNVDFFR